MKKLVSVLLLMILCSVVSIAQNKPKAAPKKSVSSGGANAKYKGHQLTVYSEDGLPFFLVLNGIQQNKEAAPSVKLIDLEMDYYRAKVVFEDEKVAGFTENIQLQGVDKGFYAMVYPIVKGKKGNYCFPGVFSGKIMFHKLDGNTEDDFDVDNNPQTDNPWEKDQVNYQYTTTTPKEVDASKLVQSSMDMMNAAMEMSANMVSGMGGNMTGSSTTTTTTSSSSSTGSGNNSNNNQRPQGGGNNQGNSNSNNNSNDNASSGNNRCVMGMNISTYNSIMSNLKTKNFDDDKVATVQRAIKNNCFTCHQLATMIAQITFEESRLTLAKSGYKKIVDRDNFQEVRDLFTFDSNKEELDQYVDSQGGN